MHRMTSDGISFHHPIAFWLGSLFLVAGVLAHAPMFAMSAHTNYLMVGMPMDATMLTGMAMIPIGLLLAAYGLTPRLEQMRQTVQGARNHAGFHLADSAPLNRAHWTLFGVLIVALSIDVMKPATLGFVMPGMTAEYSISTQTGELLALVALTGTTVGSVLWGWLADRFGRRAAILLSALMFIGTSICGAMPTGAVIILLNRWIPESPRFLSSIGLENEARTVLMKFSATRSAESSGAIFRDDDVASSAPILDEQHPIKGLRELVRGRYAHISLGLAVCGTAWGLVNFGFLLWLPTNLVLLGIPASGSSTLLAQSALFALPGIPLVVWLYHRWSTIKSLILFIALSTLSLLAFLTIAMLELQSAIATTIATVALLISISGVIAMLIPYATEIYPVQMRGTGSGVIAASSKFGGILGAALGAVGFFDHFMLSAALIAIPLAISGVLLIRNGVETRGYRLEDIQSAMARA